MVLSTSAAALRYRPQHAGEAPPTAARSVVSRALVDPAPLDLSSVLLIVPVLLFSVIAHEYAHGYAALRQGDPTASLLGRLTWNPLKHIDPFLTIVLPLVLLFSPLHVAIGGAKPVPVNPRNYRNVKRGDIIVSLAGVFTNLLLALAFTAAIPVVGGAARVVPPAAGALTVLQAMLIVGIEINLALIAFNLIPIPPLDGSHVMKYLLPPAWGARYARMGLAGLIVLVLLLRFMPDLLDIWFAPAERLDAMLIGAVQGMVLPGVSRWLR